jgi:GT2 family glycosyltransferase
MNIYVVIVTYNPKKWIDKCFSSLTKSSIPLNVIVIDNGSTDGSKEIIKERYPEIDFIASYENLGFGRANNIGIKRAYDMGADYVFLMNQDVWIEDDTLEKLTASAFQNPEYGIISPMHLNGKGDTLDYNFSYYSSTVYCENLFSDVFLNRHENKIYFLKFINAAAWLISRKCIKTVGGFNPSFFHYGEDDNYCQRVLYHGFKIGILPISKIYHDRENRAKNTYLSNYKKVYQRKLISEFSNVEEIRSVVFEKNKLYKNIISSLLRFNISEFQKVVEKLKIYNSLNINNIIKNKELSKVKGKTFL